ncbi:2-keto-4-pentenoate hydratase [Planococcus lenghuensis]|uniref:Hydratase n=1 Tax=Planococcus lenghuensis TaxID=2213202 RepID=A0A1Q2L1X8_9BACL|nr:hypothetical protein [Planococcus lenghuensis]AQQ54047.1 hypothetical protein B0X71_13685 [Planococcus lenghuensis]
MTQKTPSVQELGELLFEAYSSKVPLDKSVIPASLQKDHAYKVQHEVTSHKFTRLNEELIGYKISLTSDETQALFASDTPLYGALTSSAISDGTIELDSMFSPLIEMELIFIVQEDLTIHDNEQDILRKTLIAPGIEVPDSRFTDWFPNVSLGQVIADSAVAGKIMTGTPRGDLSYEALDGVRGVLTLNGKEIAAGDSSEVLGHPVNAIKWLVNELSMHGMVLRKGMSVSSGTFILPKPLERGTYEVDYEGIGTVTLEVK